MFSSNTSAFSTWTGINSKKSEQKRYEEETLMELVTILQTPLYNLFPHFC